MPHCYQFRTILTPIFLYYSWLQHQPSTILLLSKKETAIHSPFHCFIFGFCVHEHTHGVSLSMSNPCLILFFLPPSHFLFAIFHLPILVALSPTLVPLPHVSNLSIDATHASELTAIIFISTQLCYQVFSSYILVIWWNESENHLVHGIVQATNNNQGSTSRIQIKTLFDPKRFKCELVCLGLISLISTVNTSQKNL